MQHGARGHGRETNIARGKAECYIRLEIMLECYFSILHKWQCFNWFIVLVLVVYYEDVSLKCNGNGSLSDWYTQDWTLLMAANSDAGQWQ